MIYFMQSLPEIIYLINTPAPTLEIEWWPPKHDKKVNYFLRKTDSWPVRMLNAKVHSRIGRVKYS